jgi:alkylhydroperoxidase family enzyme
VPRIEPVSRADISDPVALYIYERKFGSVDAPVEQGTATGAPGNWELVFAHVPDVLEHVVRGFALWRNPGRDLDGLLREMAQTRAGWACGSQFVFSQHCKGMRAFGASDEQVEAIPDWQASDVFTPVQRAVLAYTDCLVYDRGRVPNGLFERLRQLLSDVEIIELTYITATYIMHAAMTRALRLEFDDRDDPIVEIPAPEGFSYPTAATPIVVPER